MKRQNKQIIMATHSGKFHADDVTAFVILKKVFGVGIKLIRTRDEEKLKKADLVFDIGNRYSHRNKLYDHHQKGGAGSRADGIPYSSVGLIWKHYGKKIVSNNVWLKIDESFIQGIDADDCGLDPDSKEGSSGSYSNIIKKFNPTGDEMGKASEYNKFFKQAVKFAESIWDRVVIHVEYEANSEKTVLKAIKNNNNGKILILNKYLPWKKALLNSDHPNAKKILYIVFPNYSGTWMCEGAPKGSGFPVRKYFPKKWAGLKGEDFKMITGISDARFCHPSLHLCGAETKKSAKSLAEIAMKRG